MLIYVWEKLGSWNFQDENCFLNFLFSWWWSFSVAGIYLLLRFLIQGCKPRKNWSLKWFEAGWKWTVCLHSHAAWSQKKIWNTTWNSIKILPVILYVSFQCASSPFYSMFYKWSMLSMFPVCNFVFENLPNYGSSYHLNFTYIDKKQDTTFEPWIFFLSLKHRP